MSPTTTEAAAVQASARRSAGGAIAAYGAERRRSTREQVFTHGLLRSLAEARATSEQVMVTDVSLHGIGFRSAQRIAIDETFSVEIGVGPLYLSARLRVVRARLRADGTYDMGGEFF
jgi:hypothetical protein